MYVETRLSTLGFGSIYQTQLLAGNGGQDPNRLPADWLTADGIADIPSKEGLPILEWHREVLLIHVFRLTGAYQLVHANREVGQCSPSYNMEGP